jgi:hypothetical protein
MPPLLSYVDLHIVLKMRLSRLQSSGVTFEATWDSNSVIA